MIYRDEQDLREQADLWCRECASAQRALFHVFCSREPGDELPAIRAVLRERFPEAHIVGASSHGSIVDGDFNESDIVVDATFFEREGTQVEVMSFPLTSGEAARVALEMVQRVNALEWVKAVETLVMNNDEPLDDFCLEMSKMREDVIIFGGESHFSPVLGAPRFVIGDGEMISWGIVFVLYGGPELHFLMRYVQGWKPLGREMRVTSSVGNILARIDGQRAFDVYHRYLQIENDEYFFVNALEFPLLFRVDARTHVLRSPMACMGEGTIMLASSVPPSHRLRICCGDPDEILHAVEEAGELFAQFRPDAILGISCSARRMFWQNEGSSRETLPFQNIASTSGYYTAGELLRVNGRLLEHNSTLIVAAAREGELEEHAPATFVMPHKRGRKSLVARFASFIDAAMEELEEANRQLEILSRTDGLTGLLNRREIERIIRQACETSEENAGALVMMDIDDFKRVNDTFGHAVGDDVLVHLAWVLRDGCAAEGADVSCGRWGGEEFICMLPGRGEEAAATFAEGLRIAFGEQPTGEVRHTLSLGVTCIGAGEDADTALTRVDAALYKAKRCGKNQVAILRME